MRVFVVGALVGLSCRSGPSAPVSEVAGSSTSPDALTQIDQPAEPTHPPDDPRPRLERADACAEGSVRVDEAAVCLRVPQRYAAERSAPGLQRFSAEDAPPITLRWQRGAPSFSQTSLATLEHLSALDPQAIQGKTRDGNGTYVYAVETQPQSHRVVHTASTLHTGQHTVWCSASAPAGLNMGRAFFEACQTLMAAR